MSYLIIGFFLIVLAYIGHYKKQVRWVLFFFMTIVLGYRYDVGTDFLSYKEYFYARGDYLEPGFNFICSVVARLSGSAYDMFYIIAFISLFFITLALNKKGIRYFPTAVLCYVFTFPFFSNGIRQGVAISIFFFAYKFIEERNLFKYVFFVTVASLFHYSILIVLPLYFIFNRSFRVKTYIFIYLISLLFIFFGGDVFFDYLESYLAFNQRYANYFENDHDMLGSYMSFGVLFRFGIYLFLFILSLKFKFNERYPLVFNLFFMAVFFFNLRIASYLFNRVEIIFSLFQYMIIPLIVANCRKKPNGIIIISMIVLAYLAFAIQTYFLDDANHLYPYLNVLTYRKF